MEPMTLGSPIGSPSSPGGSGSSYLPAFLMGESVVHSPHQHPSSPQKTPRTVTFGSPQVTPRQQTLTPQQQNRNYSNLVEQRNRSLHVTQGEKSGGPPTAGLFDTLESTSVPQTYAAPCGSISGGNFNNMMSTPLANITNTLSGGSQTINTNLVPNTPDRSSCEPGSVITADHWVTVFGFPPASAPTILAQFSQLGQLLEHIYPPKGNWVHLRYYSKMEARRAYSYNGKVFGGSTMIGVIPCKDPAIVKDLALGPPQSPAMLPRRLISPADPSTSTPINTSNWGDTSYTGSPRARPLVRTPHPDNEVVGQQNTPTKSTSIVSKTFDYVFGW